MLKSKLQYSTLALAVALARPALPLRARASVGVGPNAPAARVPLGIRPAASRRCAASLLGCWGRARFAAPGEDRPAELRPQNSRWVLGTSVRGLLAPTWPAGKTARPPRQASGDAVYQLTRLNGVSWLVAPNGSRGLLLGLNHVHLVSASAPRTDLAPAYVDQRAAEILAGLRQDGFNALGGDSDADLWHRGLPYVQTLDLSLHLQADQQTPFFDVYAPDFRARVQALAQAACAPRARDPELIGYFSDDGLAWEPSRPGQAVALLRYYLGLPLASAGRRRATDFLRIRYNSDIGAVKRAWGVKARDFLNLTGPGRGAAAQAAFAADAAGFAERVLLRYLGAAAEAIHAADPNHLYLGATLQPAAAEASGTGADVTSVAVADAADVAAVVALLRRHPRHALLVRVAGCDPPPDLRPLLAAPAVVGTLWSPSGDWQSGACAAQAATWAQLNHAASALHAGGSAPPAQRRLGASGPQAGLSMPPRAVTAGRLTSGTRGAPARRRYRRGRAAAQGPAPTRIEPSA